MISSINRAHDWRKGICIDPIYIVLLSGHGCIYSNVNNYETKNKTLVDIKYKWENMAAASILTLLLTKSHSRRDISVDEMSEMFPTLFSSCKWYGVRCSDHLKLVPYIQVCLICGIFVVMFSVRLAGWPEGWQSVVCGKNFNVVIFSDTINMTYVKLCMKVVLTELYLFMPLSVTLIVFQDHSSVKQF